MTDGDGRRPRAGRRTIALGGVERRFGGPGAIADALSRLFSAVSAAFHTEADAARLAPWLAVFFGIGILIYFAAPAEPWLWSGFLVAGLLIAVAHASRERPVAFAVSIALLWVTAGFTAGCVRGALVAQPVLTRATGMVTLTGLVEARDGTERSDRIVLLVSKKEGPGAERVPERVRVAVRKGTAPAVGERVELRARLRPLIGPARPGGFDFARNAYFLGLGATGFTLGRVTVLPPADVSLELHARAMIDAVRQRTTERIRAVLPGETGAVASALVTGMRDVIPAAVNEAMRVSGLAHVLAISGLHMVLVVGTMFALVRGGLALVPGLALRHPVKKWAAVIAFIAAVGYLVLSGAAVSTQRAFVMIAVVLVGVLVDRPALTLRTLGAAAVVLLALTPEALLSPSFQMSFAATLALVSLFERFGPLMARPPADGGAFVRFSERAGRWLLLGAATSLAAGLATGIYAAFHFHRVAPFGLISNVLAMPVLSFVIMPAGLLSVLLTPFGYDALGWKVMGFGIELMLSVARWVSELPGAEGRVTAFGSGAVLLATSGLLLLTIPVSWLRHAGVPVLLLALVWAYSAPRPDVLVDPENGTVAVRGADGRLAILDAKKSRLTSELWLTGDADGRAVSDALAEGFRCDARGCTARLGDGTLVAVARTREALFDDCREAGLVIANFDVPLTCRAPVIDRRTLATTGALSLQRVDGRWIAEAARAPDADRPWFGRARRPEAHALERLAGATPPPRLNAPVQVRDDDELLTPDVPEDGEEEDQ